MFFCCQGYWPIRPDYNLLPVQINMKSMKLHEGENYCITVIYRANIFSNLRVACISAHHFNVTLLFEHNLTRHSAKVDLSRIITCGWHYFRCTFFCCRNDWGRVCAVKLFVDIVCLPNSDQEKHITKYCPLFWRVSKLLFSVVSCLDSLLSYLYCPGLSLCLGLGLLVWVSWFGSPVCGLGVLCDYHRATVNILHSGCYNRATIKILHSR